MYGNLLLKIVRSTASKMYSGTVIFFHGSGSTGEFCSDSVSYLLGKKFSFGHLKVIFPTAPLQPYTLYGGELSNVWFDRSALSANVPECIESIENIGKVVKQLIKSENDNGIPTNRIVVGGISMGGALAFYTGYKWEPSVAGVFAMSSFLNNNSSVYKYLETNKGSIPELIQFHGVEDDLVPLETARSTYEQLTSRGVKGKFIVDDEGEHFPNTSQLSTVMTWIQSVLPPL